MPLKGATLSKTLHRNGRSGHRQLDECEFGQRCILSHWKALQIEPASKAPCETNNAIALASSSHSFICMQHHVEEGQHRQSKTLEGEEGKAHAWQRKSTAGLLAFRDSSIFSRERVPASGAFKSTVLAAHKQSDLSCPHAIAAI